MSVASRSELAVPELLQEQWAHLRRWLEVHQVLQHGARPSGLGEWTVADLVAHLGYGLMMVAEVREERDARPVSVGDYVAGYATAHEQIADDTVTTSARMRDDVLAGVDRMVERAWQAVPAMPEVVRGRRGPLTSDDFLRTRLIELVVHGDDLHRALGGQLPSPVLPQALSSVADVLRQAYVERTGSSPSSSGLDLVRQAAGRVATPDPALPLLS